MQLWELCCAEIWYRWLSRQTSSSAERESTALSSAATAAECVCLQMQHLSAGICLLLLLLSQVRFRSFLPYQSVWLALYGSGAIAISFPLPPTTSSSSFFPSFYLSRRYLVHFASSFVPYIQIVKFLEPRRNLYTNCWHSLRTDATRPDVYLKWRWERDGLRVQQPGRARALISRFQFHIYIYIPALVLFWYAIRRSLAIRSQHAVQFPQVEFSLSLGYCLQILLLCVAASIISLPLVKSVGAARPFPSFHYSDCRSLCHSTGGLASSVPREILLLLLFFSSSSSFYCLGPLSCPSRYSRPPVKLVFLHYR